MSDQDRSEFVYVTYIRTTPERLWNALTDSAETPKYWLGVTAEADWREGGAWSLVFADGRVADTGEITVFEPQKRMVIRWNHQLMPEIVAEGPSTCEMTLETAGEAVKLTVRHSIDRPQSKLVEAVSGGWPQILSNLKSLLETGVPAVDRRI